MDLLLSRQTKCKYFVVLRHTCPQKYARSRHTMDLHRTCGQQASFFLRCCSGINRSKLPLRKSFTKRLLKVTSLCHRAQWKPWRTHPTLIAKMRILPRERHQNKWVILIKAVHSCNKWCRKIQSKHLARDKNQLAIRWPKKALRTIQGSNIHRPSKHLLMTCSIQLRAREQLPERFKRNIEIGFLVIFDKQIFKINPNIWKKKSSELYEWSELYLNL